MAIATLPSAAYDTWKVMAWEKVVLVLDLAQRTGIAVPASRRVTLAGRHVLVSDTDDHLRDHGSLHAGGTSCSLAPAFDLNPQPDPGPHPDRNAVT